MSLVLYNTLSKKKEVFKPIEDGKVKIYLCGPTVYDLLHIGNFRGAICFNLLRNWMEKGLGHEVTFVYNYTDVDDKIIKRSSEVGMTPTQLSSKYIKEFEIDFKRLGLRPHEYNPKVTDHIDDIVSMVEKLIENNKAYVVDGEVFYSIDSFETYGQLSGKKLEDLNAGQRVEVDERKKNPFDFVLWKPSKEGEISWESPWGNGRPGWHIECSAMINNILGDQIDIHAGGIDLIFPHHENEIAQSEGHSCKKYCNYWLHNNFINMKDEKMSKSLGNVIKAREFMDNYHEEVLKYLMLSTHYRSVLTISDEKIEQSISGLGRIYNALSFAEDISDFATDDSAIISKSFSSILDAQDRKIKKAMNDDLNSGEVIASIFEVVRGFNGLNLLKKAKDKNSAPTAKAFILWVKKYGKMMALFDQNPKTFLTQIDDLLLRERKIERSKIDELINLRTKAREEKDWAKSDVYKDELTDLGIEFCDTPQGTVWQVKK